jgi:hypothetical protein
MKKSIVAGAIAVVAVFAGVLYFAGDFRNDSPAKAAPAKSEAKPPAPADAVAARPPVSKSTAASRPVISDPRLAALMVSPDNSLIDFFADAEGRVIKEIDNDPNSPSFGRSLREYTYAGDKVIRLVVYRYLGGQVQVVTADVVYKPDGSIDRYEESTRYQ